MYFNSSISKITLIIILLLTCTACHPKDVVIYKEVWENESAFEFKQEKLDNPYSFEFNLKFPSITQTIYHDHHSYKLHVKQSREAKDEYKIEMKYKYISTENELHICSPRHIENSWSTEEPNIEITYHTKNHDYVDTVHWSGMGNLDDGLYMAYSIKLYDYILKELNNEEITSMSFKIDNLYVEKWIRK